ncbi:MAG: LytR C-terminal domain-containing protein [Candidatus Cloacimonetes bacterium]|nr:LytR C-terminal domain-containing protein [Candidatus Cloacimonadota bacterium]
MTLIYLCITIFSSSEVTENNKAETSIEKYDIAIQVLNGCGKSGLAREVRNILIDKGLNVLSFGNADKFAYMKTVLIIRKMNPEKLETIKKFLPIQHIYRQIKTDSLYDFVIIVGKDYKKYFNEMK